MQPLADRFRPATLDDIVALRDMDLYGALLGKALYTGDLDLKDAVKLARVNRP